MGIEPSLQRTAEVIPGMNAVFGLPEVKNQGLTKLTAWISNGGWAIGILNF